VTTAAEAMEQSEKQSKKRHKLTNYDLIDRYTKRKEKANKTIDRAMLKVLRAASYLQRARAEKQTCDRTLKELVAAINDGALYPKPKPKKKKAGRRIEL
jgi:hypothetical protein